MDAMDAIWKESMYKGFRSLVGENGYLRVEVVPERGSKLVSFKNKETGREWVYHNDKEWSPLKYGMLWEEGDREGWDEMFPTVVTCPYPERPWQHVQIPDHGEVWSLPWFQDPLTRGIKLSVQGVQLPYTLYKEYHLEGRRLMIDYELDNRVPFPLYYMWASHFLLNIEEGMEVMVDPSQQSVVLYHSHQVRLGKYFEEIPYPQVMTEDGKLDLSRVGKKDNLHAEKYWFNHPIKQGWLGISTPQGEKLIYQYQPEEIPYLGVWANYGGFWGEYNYAFEVATGFLDNLYLAHNLQKVKKVEPYSSQTWQLSIKIEEDSK